MRSRIIYGYWIGCYRMSFFAMLAAAFLASGLSAATDRSPEAIGSPVGRSLSSAPVRPSFRGLGFIPAAHELTESRASSVSADGKTVVGGSRTSGGSEAVMWHSGTLHRLGDLEGGLFSSGASAVNADGTRIVGAGRPASGHEAVLWDNGLILGLGDVQGGIPGSGATGISWAGDVIVGHGTMGQAVIGFVWTGEKPEVLPVPHPDCLHYSASAISGDGSIIVGTCQMQSRTIGVFWDSLMPRTLQLPVGYSEAWSVSGASKNGSTIVGAIRNPTSRLFEATRWVDGTCEVLLPGAYSLAWATSGDGSVIVGTTSTDGSSNKAFVWYADRGVMELGSFLVDDLQLNLGGFALTEARSVSADGSVIVGYGTNPNGRPEAWLAVVPTDIEGDADLDGVPDYRDACDYTMPGASVDPAGCPPRTYGDTDRDGDFDLQDFSRLLPCMHGANAPVPISCGG